VRRDVVHYLRVLCRCPNRVSPAVSHPTWLCRGGVTNVRKTAYPYLGRWLDCRVPHDRLADARPSERKVVCGTIAACEPKLLKSL
jgi:hypothetical protein